MGDMARLPRRQTATTSPRGRRMHTIGANGLLEAAKAAARWPLQAILRMLTIWSANSLWYNASHADHVQIQVLDTQIAPPDPSSDDPNAAGIDFVTTAEATCAYPVTRLSWEPPSSQKQSTDLLATSGDHLRLWSLPNNQQPQMHSNNINRSATANTRDAPVAKLLPLALLSNSKTPEHTAPLTSLDWNTLSPKLIITSSIDTTCTIWDIPTLTAKTQLIAHDKEVFDVRFCAGSVDVFVSCGADGSVRMFDLRSLEHSTIIYEPAEKNDQDSGESRFPLIWPCHD